MHKLEQQQLVPMTLSKAWEFFSSPENLEVITPDHMGFHIIEGGNVKMYPGQIIRYKVSPMYGLKVNWVTEITQVLEENYFVDEQRFGPYTFWHHKHFFKEVEGGTEITDIIHYKLPMGLLGKLINTFMVKKQLDSIFTYRRKKIMNFLPEVHI